MPGAHPLPAPQGTPADVLYKGTITRIIGEDSPSRLDRSREDGLPKGHVIYEGKKGHVLSYEGESSRERPRGLGEPGQKGGHRSLGLQWALTVCRGWGAVDGALGAPGPHEVQAGSRLVGFMSWKLPCPAWLVPTPQALMLLELIREEGPEKRGRGYRAAGCLGKASLGEPMARPSSSRGREPG